MPKVTQIVSEKPEFKSKDLLLGYFPGFWSFRELTQTTFFHTVITKR